jgi:hypothetical protein
MKQSEALTRGGQVLNLGKESIRPIELGQEIADMSAAQKNLLSVGARAEIDRIVGTKASDTTALKQLIQSEGDWNRAKLAQLFGMDKADRIINVIERENEFQNNFRQLTQNSQTAQRLAGAKAVEAETGRAPTKTDLTLMGALVGGGQWAYRTLADALLAGRRSSQDTELARALTKQGPERDQLVQIIRDAQNRRKRSGTSAGDELARALMNARAAQ